VTNFEPYPVHSSPLLSTWIKSVFFVISRATAFKAGSYEGERHMARGGIEPPIRGFSVLCSGNGAT
jgi:hypothetical protein